MSNPEPQQQPNHLVVASGISKSYGSAVVLNDINLAIGRGEVHGLVGANGAGKSTFIKILSGVTQPNEGSIHVDGVPVSIRNPHEALRLGLGFIHQDVNMVPGFTGIQNMVMGIPKDNKFGWLNWRKLKARTQTVIEELGIHFPMNIPVKDLSLADRTLISVARALMIDARLIAFDEPTASLSDKETQRIFDIIHKLSSRGISILYVSHRLDEITRLCDRATVFRDGTLIETLEEDALVKDRLVEGIVGKSLSTSRSLVRNVDTVGNHRPLLEVTNLSGSGVQNVSFELFPGEVLGFGGLVGSGRTELMRMIFGIDNYSGGDIKIKGIKKKIRSTKQAIKEGIALVPEERRQQGLVMNKALSFNINLTDLRGARSVPSLPFVSSAKSRDRSSKMIDLLRIKTKGPSDLVKLLSGGNQQKVVIAKWLTNNSEILILDEPTVGVDVGAREEIYKTIWDLASQGKGVIVVSSDPDELVQICSRVIVMADGKLQGELKGSLTKEAILNMSFDAQHT